MRKLAIAALLASGVTPASSARLVNPSFETSAPVPVAESITLPAGSPVLTGWTIVSGNIDLVSTYWNASSGRRSIDLNGTQRGEISTTMSGMIIGRTYDLSFDMAANPTGPANAKIIRVTAGLDSATFSRSRGTGSRSAMNWATMLFSFTATAVDQLLTFRAMNGNGNGAGSGAAIDNLRVTLQPVPLPATAPLAALGLAALAFLRRRRVQ